MAMLVLGRVQVLGSHPPRTATHWDDPPVMSGRDAVEAFGLRNDSHGSEESADTQGEVLEKCWG